MRINDEKRKLIVPGDQILFHGTEDERETLLVEVVDIKAVPEQFRKPIEMPEVMYTVDKQAAKAWYKSTGEIIPGLDIQQKQSVVFR